MDKREKKGFDFFPLKVDYDEDPKIVELVDQFGPLAELIFIKILCIIYKEGYYTKRNKLELRNAIFRRLSGPHTPSLKVVDAIIDCMTQIGLIEKPMLDRSVVTSHGIQETYMNMAIRRRNKVVEFSLLSDAEMVEFGVRESEIDVTTSGDNVAASQDNVTTSTPIKSKVKESKVNKSKKDELEINIDKDFYEEYFEPSKWTKVLIDNGIISSADLRIPNYNALFKEVIDSYKVTDMARAYGYLVHYLKHPSIPISDMYAYIRHALINNTDWVSHEDERIAYFEQLSEDLEEYRKQQEASDEDLNDDDLPF